MGGGGSVGGSGSGWGVSVDVNEVHIEFVVLHAIFDIRGRIRYTSPAALSV